jgi:hypothetical protein
MIYIASTRKEANGSKLGVSITTAGRSARSPKRWASTKGCQPMRENKANKMGVVQAIARFDP